MSDRFDMTNYVPRQPQPKGGGAPQSPVGGKFSDALADNMGIIITLTRDILDLEKMKAQSAADLAKMKECRKMLRAEAEAYVYKKDADTRIITTKMDTIRLLLADFYAHRQTASDSAVTGEEFAHIITSILERLE